MTNVSTGNKDTHPESKKTKIIKAKQQSINLRECVAAIILSIKLQQFRKVQMKKNIANSCTFFFYRNVQKSRFFWGRILCVKTFSLRQYIASKDSLFSLIIMFLDIKFLKECSIMFCSPKNLVHANTVKMAARFVVIQCKILHSESTPDVPLMQNRAQSTIRNRAKRTNQQRNSSERTLTGKKPV